MLLIMKRDKKIGYLISVDEMELIFLVDGNKAFAEVCTLKKM